jgi:hypothetical protein
MVEAAGFLELCQHARRRLSHVSNVIGVGFGFKETGGAVTQVPAFRTYVRRKLSICDVSRDQRIPKAMFGIPTDVLPELRGSRTSVGPGGGATPLAIGAAISNLKAVLSEPKIQSAGAGIGTLSFIAAENGASARRTLVAVSNRHVLLANGAGLGDTVYQPSYVVDHGVTCVMRGHDLNPIAEISNEGLEGNDSYAYAGEPASSYFLDCAAARLLPVYARGVRPRFAVAGEEKAVKGMARLHPLDTLAGRELRVHAVTAMSGLVKGRVVDVAAPVRLDDGEPRHNNIVMRAEAAAPVGRDLIQEGDSGALLVDERGRAVGLLWGKNRANPSEAFACHLHPVVARLDVTLATYNLGEPR